MLKVLCHKRTFALDAFEHILDRLIRPLSHSLVPPGVGADALLGPRKTQSPMTKPPTGDDGCIVCPMLKDAAPFLKQLGQHLAIVAWEPCEQRQMMGPFQDIDRIDLHVTDVIDQLHQGRGCDLLGMIRAQPLRIQKKPASGLSIYQRLARRDRQRALALC